MGTYLSGANSRRIRARLALRRDLFAIETDTGWTPRAEVPGSESPEQFVLIRAWHEVVTDSATGNGRLRAPSREPAADATKCPRRLVAWPFDRPLQRLHLVRGHVFPGSLRNAVAYLAIDSPGVKRDRHRIRPASRGNKNGAPVKQNETAPGAPYRRARCLAWLAG